MTDSDHDSTGAIRDAYCFVAGTLIATPAGAVAIEDIRAGDSVYSRSPETHEEGVRSVLETYISHPTALYHIDVDWNGDGESDETISSTGEHPYYVSSREDAGFVPAQDLRAGDQLVVRGGESAFVESVKLAQAPQGTTFTTYNFAVVDDHTYYAGEGEIWVHNLCPAGVNRYLAKIDNIYQSGLNSGLDSATAWKEATASGLKRARIKDNSLGLARITDNDAFDVARALFEGSPNGLIPREAAFGSALNLPLQQAEELAAIRKYLDRPNLGTAAGEKFTFAKLETPTGPVFGASHGGANKTLYLAFLRDLATEMGEASATRQAAFHAEGFAIIEAWNRGKLVSNSVLYVDRAVCTAFCRKKGGLSRILKHLGIDEITIIDPDNPAGFVLLAE